MRPCSIAVPTLLLLASMSVARADDSAKPRIEHVFSEVEGERTVVFIVPDGSRVTKGQIVCVLNAGPETGALKDLRIKAAQAEASYQQAKLAHQVAEVAVVEYEQGTFKQSLETIEGNIALAQAELKRAEDRYDWASRMLQRNPMFGDGVARAEANKFNVDRARFTLEQARTSKDVLQKYTKDKTLTELRGEVEKARADERAKKEAWEAERANVKRIEWQARAQVVLAPIDGTARLARPTRLVEAGAEVCKDQLLLRVVPTGK
jgi:biotin carboxyl carrier protein